MLHLGVLNREPPNMLVQPNYFSTAVLYKGWMIIRTLAALTGELDKLGLRLLELCIQEQLSEGRTRMRLFKDQRTHVHVRVYVYYSDLAIIALQ